MMKQHGSAGKAFKVIVTFKGLKACHFFQGLYLCTCVCVCVHVHVRVCSLGLMVAVKDTAATGATLWPKQI